MTRDVLVRISGLQLIDGEHDDVEVITSGDYFWKNGKHYILYDEVIDGIEESIRNTIKISENRMEVKKTGAATALLSFAEGERSTTSYATPMGEMLVQLTTTKIEQEWEEDHLHVAIDYSLDINYDHVSDCQITVDVCPRVGADLQLMEE